MEILYFDVLLYKAVTRFGVCVKPSLFGQLGSFHPRVREHNVLGDIPNAPIDRNARNIIEASRVFSNLFEQDLVDIRIRF